MQSELRQLLPQSIEAEMSVLGAIFCQNSCAPTVTAIVEEGDFYRESHRKIFRAMMQLSDRNEPCDLITMVDLLRKQGELEEVGGAAYLATLVDYVPTAANVGFYCKIIKEKALYRRIIATGNELASIGWTEAEQPLDEVEKLLSGLAQGKTAAAQAMPAKAVLREVVVRLQERHAGRADGLPYGLPELDRVTGGLHRGDLGIIGGRPSMGKTAAALCFARSACVAGAAVRFQSYEMDRRDVMERLLSTHGNVPYGSLRRGSLSTADFSRLERTKAEIEGWKLVIDDTAGVTLPRLKSESRRQKLQLGLDVLIVDYLQLMPVNPKENRTVSLGEITRSLKQLARELDMTVLLLSQLNRGVDARPEKRPMLSDLRESGEIEQDADLVLFPFRPAAYCPKCQKRVNDADHIFAEHQALAEIGIAKHRNGELVTVPAVWLGQYQKFEAMPSGHVVDLD